MRGNRTTEGRLTSDLFCETTAAEYGISHVYLALDSLAMLTLRLQRHRWISLSTDGAQQVAK